MTIEEINQEIERKIDRMKVLHKEGMQLKDELNKLYEDRKEKEMESFFDFIEIGTQININNWCGVSGYANGETLKKFKEKNPNYRPYKRGLGLKVGSIIEIDKVNKSSINIKIVKLTKTVGDAEYPNSTYRVDRRKLYLQLMRDPEFKNRVETTAKRKSVLDAILD